MKKLITFLMAALAVSLLSAQNLIQDQSFEKKYDNWTMWNGDCVDNSKSHSCKYAAHCKLRESQTLIATQKSAVQLQPNTDYVYSGWIYKTTSDAHAYIDMTDAAGELQLEATKTGEWEHVQGVWNSGSTGSVTLRCVIEGYVTGDIWFDDIEFYPQATSLKIIFVNKDNWDRPSLHAWDGKASGTTWPGFSLVKTGQQKLGYDVYEQVVAPGDYKKVIFSNNGNNQTADLSLDESKPVYYNGVWYASLDDIVDVAHTVIIDGSSYGCETFQLKNTTDDDTYTGSINLTGSQYQFKIKADSETRSDANTYTNSFVDKKMSKDKGRTTLTTSVAGEYQFKYVVSSKLLSVTYPDSPTPSQHTVKVGGYKSDTGVEDFNLTSSDNDTFTGSVSLSANYQFKIDVDGTKYSDGSTFTETATKTLNSSSSRNHLTICTSGTYQFQYVVSTKQLTVTYPECPVVYPSVQVRGIGSWDGVEMDTEDGENYTKTFTLSSNVEFKLYYNGEWYSSGGTVTKDNCTDLDFSKTGGNAKLEITNAGDYIFSFVYSTKKLSVTYPTLDNPTVVTVSSADDSQGTVSPAEVEVNATSSAQITATGINGYKFSTWSLAGCTTDDALTSATINIKGDGESATGTAVASFVVDPDAKVVYFVNTNGWSSPYIYFWDPEKKSWPGDAMAKTTMTATSAEYEVWSYTYTGTYAKCKFNCGSSECQTPDLMVDESKPYYYPADNTWYASIEDIPEPEYITLVYVNKYGWSNVNVQMKGGSSSMNWPGVAMTKTDDKKFGFDVYSYTFEKGAYTKYIINKGDGGDQFETDVEDDLYVHYGKTKYASLDDIKVYLSGEFNDWSSTANIFSVDEIGVGTTSITLSANTTYEFKVYDGAWLGNIGTITETVSGWTFEKDKDNCKITTKNKGEFTFTYDVKTSKLSVTYPEMVTGFSLIINDTEIIDLAKNETVTDYNEYYVHDVEFATGDVLTFLNKYDDGKFVVSNLDRSDDLESAVSGHSTGIKVDWQGRYDVYLKMYEGYDNNWVYMEGLPILDDVSAPEEYYGNRTGKSGSYIVKRVLDTQSYNTLCLPFSLSAAQIAETPLAGSSILKYVDAVISGSGTSMEATLRFADVSEIEAGKPYLILPAEDILEPMEINDVTISVSEGSTEGDGKVEAVGILKPTHLSGGDPNNLFLGLNNTFYWPAAGDTSSLKGMRAYFHVLLPQMIQFKAPAKLQIMAPLPTGDNVPDGESTNGTYKTFNEQNIVIIVQPDGTINTLDGKEVK